MGGAESTSAPPATPQMAKKRCCPVFLPAFDVHIRAIGSKTENSSP